MSVGVRYVSVRRLRWMSGIHSLPFIVRQSLSLNPELTNSSGLLSQLTPVLLSLLSRITGGLPCPPGIYIVAGDPNSCPQVCMTSVLSAQLPQAPEIFLLHFLKGKTCSLSRLIAKIR